MPIPAQHITGVRIDKPVVAKCLQCGHNLHPKEIRVSFGNRDDEGAAGDILYRKAIVYTIADVRLLFPDHFVLRVSNFRRTDSTDNSIHTAYLWDGKSYQREFFDSMTCAADFGTSAAKNGWRPAP